MQSGSIKLRLREKQEAKTFDVWRGLLTYDQLVTNREPQTDMKVMLRLEQFRQNAFDLHFEADSDGEPAYNYSDWEDKVGPNHPDFDPEYGQQYWFFHS